ncbi:MAG: hypothetical protein IJY18_04845 [Clostridia bacterium]|nr:hypothetical protein [Clostridia bacterium]
MSNVKKATHIAYRCPECGSAIFGLVGEFALGYEMLRLKCSCGEASLDISKTADNKLKLTVPCVLCKDTHSFVISPSIFFDRDVFSFNCPYANVDIAFIGDKEKIDGLLEENERSLRQIISNMGGEELSDIQPIDVDEEDALVDPMAYDIIRFMIKDLEAEGKVDCPCHSGSYDLRYAPGGIQVFCPECGATKFFPALSPSAAEDYVTEVTSVKLT